MQTAVRSPTVRRVRRAWRRARLGVERRTEREADGMKVFVTGGTGYVGSAVALRLKKAGHDVSALVRSKEKGAALQGAGIKLVVGDLGNPAGYAAAAYGAQAFVHVAQDHGPAMVDMDKKAITTARELLRGSVGGPFIYTSGIWVVGDT